MVSPNAPKSRINIELLLGVSATFLSLAALVVSIFQTRIAREQQHASVWPYIQMLKTQYDQECHVGIENKGVGPALIKNAEWWYGNKKYESAQELYLNRFGPTKGGKGFGSVSKGDVLKSGDNLDLLSVVNNDSMAQVLFRFAEDTAFHLRITYGDVYGNCWQLDRNIVTPLGKCPD